MAGIYFQKRELVVPGQLLAEGRYRPSIGTYSRDGRIYSSLVGLAELRGNTIKVVPLEGVYIPREGDLVIGTIQMVSGNNWKVDIGGPYQASLHANNALRRPYDDDISRYMDIGDVIAAEVIAFDRNTGPFLTMKGRGLRKLTDGMILEVSPAKIPRIIGRRGSMISMIKNRLRIQTVVGQNGRIWIRAPDTPTMRLAIKAFKMIEDQAHTSKLTDRVSAMLDEELAKLRGTEAPAGTPPTSDTEPAEVPAETSPEASPEVPVETPPEAPAETVSAEAPPETPVETKAEETDIEDHTEKKEDVSK